MSTSTGTAAPTKYIPPWKRAGLNANSPTPSPTTDTLPPSSATRSSLRQPLPDGTYRLTAVAARLNAPRTGTVNLFGDFPPPRRRIMRGSASEHAEETGKGDGLSADVEVPINDEKVEMVAHDLEKVGLGGEPASKGSEAATDNQTADPPTITREPSRQPPPHPLSTLISFIDIKPAAHPLFPNEIWIHTNSELVSSDSRNVGRPIPMFGAKEVEKEIRFKGRDGRGRVDGARFGGGKRHNGGNVVFLGWWVIKDMTPVEPRSQELIQMLEMKEATRSYGTGRTAEAWQASLKQRWLKLKVAKWYPVSGQRMLGDPMEMFGDDSASSSVRREAEEQADDGDEGGERPRVWSEWERLTLDLVKRHCGKGLDEKLAPEAAVKEKA